MKKEIVPAQPLQPLSPDEMRRLSAGRFPDSPFVPGEGPAGATVMLIGEAPGEKESLAQRPFVGKAGNNLNEFLSGARLERRDIYVTNCVKIRPSRLSPAGHIVNRPPTREEVQFFLPCLLWEIREIAPDWIVPLGNTPLRALLGTIGRADKETIGRLHGQPLPFGEHTLYPLYHPAAVIYDRSLADVWRADIQRLAELMRKY